MIATSTTTYHNTELISLIVAATLLVVLIVLIPICHMVLDGVSVPYLRFQQQQGVQS